jgi:hypothetical protein
MRSGTHYRVLKAQKHCGAIGSSAFRGADGAQNAAGAFTAGVAKM